MKVVNVADIPEFSIPGLNHRTLASAANGVTQGEVWLQSVEPGGATPMHQHDCEEVVITLSGRGACICGDERIEFGPNTVVTLKPNVPHQIINIGDTPLTGYGFFTMGPVVIEAPGGGAIAMPWQQPQPA